MGFDAEMADLLAKKQACREACDEPNEAVRAIPQDAMLKAAAAHHVILAGHENAVSALLGGAKRIGTPDDGGSGAFVDQNVFALVSSIAGQVAAGIDPVTASGADPEHVATLQAAVDAHAPHKAELETAYAVFAAAQHADAHPQLVAGCLRCG